MIVTSSPTQLVEGLSVTVIDVVVYFGHGVEVSSAQVKVAKAASVSAETNILHDTDDTELTQEYAGGRDTYLRAYGFCLSQWSSLNTRSAARSQTIHRNHHPSRVQTGDRPREEVETSLAQRCVCMGLRSEDRAFV